MAISQTNRRNCDYAVDEIRKSDLSAALKEDLTTVLVRTLETTNGLSQAQKIQSCTENQFDMMRLFVLQIISQGRRVTTWKDVIVKCRLPLCISVTVLGVAAIVALVLQPQLAEMVEHLTGK